MNVHREYDSKIINYRSSLRLTRKVRCKAMENPALKRILEHPYGETALAQMVLWNKKGVNKIAIPNGSATYLGTRVRVELVRELTDLMVEGGVLSLSSRGTKQSGRSNVYTYNPASVEGYIPETRSVNHVLLASHIPVPEKDMGKRVKGYVIFRDAEKNKVSTNKTLAVLGKEDKALAEELIRGFNKMAAAARDNYFNITFDYGEAYKGTQITPSHICAPEQEVAPRNVGEDHFSVMGGSNLQAYIGLSNLVPRIIFNLSENGLGGGRVYHDIFGRLSSDERLHLRMYGEKVVEVDISSSQMRFCYALRGLDIPDDFYEAIGLGDRGLGKAISLVMLGVDVDTSEDLLSAINNSSIFRESGYGPISEGHFQYIEKYMGEVWPDMGRGMWAKLQLFEAKFLQRVFARYHDKTGRYLLTCHDSFMAPESDESFLVEVLETIWDEMFPGLNIDLTVDRAPIQDQARKQRKLRQWPSVYNRCRGPKRAKKSPQRPPTASQGQPTPLATRKVPHKTVFYDLWAPPPPQEAEMACSA